MAARSSRAFSTARVPRVSAVTRTATSASVESTPATPTQPPVRFCDPDDVTTEYGPPTPSRSSETRADAARLSTCSGRLACSDRACHRPDGESPSANANGTPGAEHRAERRAPQRAAACSDRERRRQRERRPQLGGDREAEQHACRAVAPRGEGPQRARDERHRPQVESRQRHGARERRAERDERARRCLGQARAPEAARRRRDGAAAATARQAPISAEKALV